MGHLQARVWRQRYGIARRRGARRPRVRDNDRAVRMPFRRYVALVAAAMGLAGCGSSVVVTTTSSETIPQGTPHAIQPAAGQHASAQTATDPVGDIHAHAPPLSQVKAELKLEHVAVPVTNATYINPLRYVTRWERTDQGVDATMSVGAPILAPCR